ASADDTRRDTHSALPSMNSTTLEWMAARALDSADGEGSMPMTLALRASSSRSKISFVTAPGPQPKSTILRRPGHMTRSTIQRLTSVKNGWRVNASNEKRSDSSTVRLTMRPPVPTAYGLRARSSVRRDCDSRDSPQYPWYRVQMR